MGEGRDGDEWSAHTHRRRHHPPKHNSRAKEVGLAKFINESTLMRNPKAKQERNPVMRVRLDIAQLRSKSAAATASADGGATTVGATACAPARIELAAEDAAVEMEAPRFSIVLEALVAAAMLCVRGECSDVGFCAAR